MEEEQKKISDNQSPVNNETTTDQQNQMIPINPYLKEMSHQEFIQLIKNGDQQAILYLFTICCLSKKQQKKLNLYSIVEILNKSANEQVKEKKQLSEERLLQLQQARERKKQKKLEQQDVSPTVKKQHKVSIDKGVKTQLKKLQKIFNQNKSK